MDSKELKKILAAINQVDDSKLEGIDFELKMNGKPVESENINAQVPALITPAEKACGCLLVLIITLLFAWGLS